MLISLGGFTSLLGLFLASYCKDLKTFLIFYCAFNGLGTGSCYMIPIICGWEWYPKRKGLITGITLGGFGFGSFIFAFVSTYLVNPENKKPQIYDAKNKVTYFDATVADRVPQMLRILVIIWCFFVLVGICTVKRKPRTKTQRQNSYGFQSASSIVNETSNSTQQNTLDENEDRMHSVDMSVDSARNTPSHSKRGQRPHLKKRKKAQLRGVRYCLFSIRFWQFFVMMFLSQFFATFFMYSFKTYGENKEPHEPISDRMLTAAASIGGGLVNGASRIFFGILMDCLGFKVIFVFLMAT